MTTHETPDWEQAGVPRKQHTISRKPILAQTPMTASAKEEGHVGSIEGSLLPVKRSFGDRFVPRFFLCRSKKVWIGVGVALIVLLALIVGLAVGLKKKSKPQNLPLPSSGGIFTGELTYYSPGPGYGSCGFENTAQEAICAVSHLVYDASSVSSNPNLNPLCGKKIRITRYNPAVGRNNSVDVMVVDRCVGCKATDLDLSISMFTTLAEEAQGRVVGSWAWLT